ncbi:1126_t:CDS:2, partial [Funneliformis caledonium]
LEGMIKEQTTQISELLKKFGDIETEEDSKFKNGDIDDVVDDVLMTNKDGQPENSDDDDLVMAD